MNDGVADYQTSDDVLNASLYLNARVSLVLLTMSFALKHNLTDAAQQDLLQLVSYIIPKPNIWVSSLYTFKKLHTKIYLHTVWHWRELYFAVALFWNFRKFGGF